MADVKEEPEVEMTDEAEEGVMIEVADEAPEIEAEAPVEETANEDQAEAEPEAEEPVEEPAPKVKRPRRKAAPKKAVEPQPEAEPEEEPEAPSEESEEDQAEDEPKTELEAVLERLTAIEALLSGTSEEGEPVVDDDAVARADKAERDLLAFKIGTRYELPEELIEVLKGDDEETIEGHAKRLAGVSGSGGGSLGKGGLDPDEESFDAKGFIKSLRKKSHGGL